MYLEVHVGSYYPDTNDTVYPYCINLNLVGSKFSHSQDALYGLLRSTLLQLSIDRYMTATQVPVRYQYLHDPPLHMRNRSFKCSRLSIPQQLAAYAHFVRSCSGVENYFTTTGATCQRMMWTGLSAALDSHWASRPVAAWTVPKPISGRSKMRRKGTSATLHNDEHGGVRLRCTYCNKMRFRTPAALERHEKRTCPFRPRERTRSSVIGRHILNKRRDAVQAAMPAAQVTDRHGNQHTLTGHRCSVYLGHLGASDGTTHDDQRRRMAIATADFWKAAHMFQHPLISADDKLVMFRAYIMQLVYAAADTWILTDKVQGEINNWTASKVRHITGRTQHQECSARTVDTVAMILHQRRKKVGAILRSPSHDPRRQELMHYAEAVRLKVQKREGGLLMNAPAYESPQHLARLAGYV
eukprot:SAG31_NODE_788_length_12088_cov_3.916090_1_plen_411_part_10